MGRTPQEKALIDIKAGIRIVARENGIDIPGDVLERIARETIIRASYHVESL